MLLSVGMIVKNEEKYLDRCLTAIKPILDNIDSELIIADTGSSDRTVEIAHKYTGKVFTFKWVNDFAAARNSTLEKASGEWYMFLDADEIFRSCDDIIKFFNSGEYRKFNSATYIIHSIYSSGNSSDFDAHRLTKICDDTAFSGIVHEQLNTFGEPIRRLTDVADHYGYSDDADANEKKFKRNSELLLKKLDLQDDSDPLIFLQLYECFYLHDRTRAEKYLEQGIIVCEKTPHPVLIALYCHKAHLLYFDNKFAEVLAVCDKYFSMSGDIRNGRISTDGEMLAFRASSLLALERSSDAADCYREYFGVFNELESGRLHTKDADMLVYFLASAQNLSVTIYEFLKACIMTADPHTAAEGIDIISLKEREFPAEHLNAIIGCLTQVINGCSDIHDTEILFEKLGELGMQYAKGGRSLNESVPDNIKAALCAAEISALKYEKQYEKCHAALRNAAVRYPDHAEIFGRYLKAVEKSSGADNGGTMTELQRLAVQVKSNIQRMIAAGDLISADNILRQYEQIASDDPDITALRERIK